MSKYNLETCDDVYEGNGDTVLSALKSARVISVKKKNDKFRIRERCDRYFEAHLTKQELIDLANELLALADT